MQSCHAALISSWLHLLVSPGLFPLVTIVVMQSGIIVERYRMDHIYYTVPMTVLMIAVMLVTGIVGITDATGKRKTMAW